MCECKHACFFLPNPCLCDGSAQQLKQRGTLEASHWRGPHCLNIVVVLAVVYGRLGLLRVGALGRTTHSPPPPPFPVPNKPSSLCGRKVTCAYLLLTPQPLPYIALYVQVLLLLLCA